MAVQASQPDEELITPKPKVKAEKQPEEQKYSVPKIEEGPALELQDAAPDAAGPWVQYNGIATLRIMDAEAWKSAGVPSDKYIEWNYLNNKRVPLKQFNDAELAYLLKRDGRFSRVE